MVNILIGEKERPFKFGMNAASIFCKETGKSLDDLNNIGAADIGSVIAMVYAGLFQGAKSSKQDVDFDLWDVGDWMDDIDPKELSKAFSSMEALGGEKEKAPRPKKA